MKRIVSFIFAVLLLPGIVFAQQETLVLNTAFTWPVGKIFEEVMKEAFQRNGLDVVVQAPTAERGLQHANRGIDDGDGPRIAGLSRLYPNLIQVPEKIVDVEFTAFSKKDIPVTNSWDSLDDYRVGILIGWKILEENLASASLRKVKDAETLFRLLNDGRIDVAVINRVDGQAVIRQMNMDGIKALQPPLDVKEMFLYLHRKHEDLVPKIDRTLKEMKADGTYQKIVDSVLNRS